MPSVPHHSNEWSRVLLKAAAAEAAVVAGGIVAGVVGAAATRNAVTDLRDQDGPLWAPGTDSVSDMAAYLAVGSLPMAVPFALAAALTPASLVARHPAYVWGGTNALLLGAYPAALAIGFSGLEQQSPPHAALVATLVGTVIVIGIELGVVMTAVFSGAVLHAIPQTRRLLPAPIEQFFAGMRESGRGDATSWTEPPYGASLARRATDDNVELRTL